MMQELKKSVSLQRMNKKAYKREVAQVCYNNCLFATFRRQRYYKLNNLNYSPMK